jgi:hypothetical protein
MSENAACPRNQPETEQHQSGRFRNLRERHRAEVQPFGIAHVVAELESDVDDPAVGIVDPRRAVPAIVKVPDAERGQREPSD